MDTDTEQDAPTYAPPLDRLLTRGAAEAGNAGDWPDYVQELELGPPHIPDLIRIATDHDLRWKEGDSPDTWAPVHAWRALGQLHAEAATDPLLALLADPNDEWVWEELPQVYGLIGPAAIPALTTYIADADHDRFGRSHAVSSLGEIAERHPESYDEVVAVLMRLLEAAGAEEAELNAFLVSELTDLKATAALPLMEQAFADGRVLTEILDWAFVQHAFGLMTDEAHDQLRAEERRRHMLTMPEDAPGRLLTMSEEEPEYAPLMPSPGGKPTAARAKAKTKRKMAEQSRKKNKKRK